MIPDSGDPGSGIIIQNKFQEEQPPGVYVLWCSRSHGKRWKAEGQKPDRTTGKRKTVNPMLRFSCRSKDGTLTNSDPHASADNSRQAAP